MSHSKKTYLFKNSGYTLIEILLVVSLVMVTCLALSSATLQGVKLFIRIGMNGQDRQAGVMMDRLSRDLRSMTNYSGVIFSYSNDRMTFAKNTFSELPGDIGVTEISYFFDKESGEIIRREKRFATALSPETEKGSRMMRFLTDYHLTIQGDQYRNPRLVTLNISYGGYFGVRQIEKKWIIPGSWVS
ncbi:MAG: hypothetical protein KC649_05610 [Candidatus Omnitrophica bacterium]|nr:hypothetical protein [Candidatus Omnitrophota bacterium]